MPDLSFTVESAEAVEFAATPQLVLRLRISQMGEGPPELIHAIALRCQIRIDPLRRRYPEQKHGLLTDLFGQPDLWSQTMRSLLWVHTSVMVPPFLDSVLVNLPVPCSFDFNIAATKYFYALDEGDVPLCLLFSGMMFLQHEESGLQAAQIPWENETIFRLPVATWRTMMEHYYPDSAWLCLQSDVFDRLAEYKSRHGTATWDQVLVKLLEAAEEADHPVNAGQTDGGH